MTRPPSEIVTLKGDEVVATLPEGTSRTIKVTDLIHRMLPGGLPGLVPCLILWILIPERRD